MSELTGFKVMPLTKKEAAFLPEMLYQAIYVPESYPSPPREIVHQPELEKYIQGWGREGDLGFIVVKGEAEQVVGAAWLRLFTGQHQGYGYISDDTPELTIAVKEGYRDEGIGTLLLQQLLEAARKCFSSISLSVSIGNSAIHLYERFGFEVVGRGGDAITMRKKLT